MIGVTEQAKEELKEILVSKVDDPRACLRIQADDEGQLGVTIDIEMPGDQTVEYEGSTLLVAEQELAEVFAEDKGTATRQKRDKEAEKS